MNSPKHKKEISDIFIASRNKSEEILNRNLNQDKLEITTFFKSFNKKLIRYKGRIKKYAPEYNLFTILNIGHLEAKVHSPFLRNLLDPNGSHAQGSLFVRKFFNQLALFQDLTINYDRLEVITESYTGDGFIDIVIRYRDQTNPFFVIIENKIYASDQEKQLERYYNFAKNQLNLNDSQIKLFYLKPHLEDPTEWSVDVNQLEKWKNSELFKLISYDYHILEWLKACLTDIPDVVKHSIKQYIKTIKNL